MSRTLVWSDFAQLAWEKTPYGQFTFTQDHVEITLLEPDYTGRAELMVQAVTARDMSQRRIHFDLPVTIGQYNEAITIMEQWHSVSLGALKWTDDRL